MSKYTTEVRFICEQASGLGESKGFNDVNEIINNSLSKIFNFNYPIFDENYRTIIEAKILKHYYLREIGEETVGLWKLRLDTRLNEIMPYYNKLYLSELLEFNPLYTTNITREKDGTVDGTRTENETVDENRSESKSGKELHSGDISTTGSSNTTNSGSIESINGETTNTNYGSTSDTTNNSTNWELYSDTPQGTVGNINDNTYLTNATKTTNNGTVNVVNGGTDNVVINGSVNSSNNDTSNTTNSEVSTDSRQVDTTGTTINDNSINRDIDGSTNTTEHYVEKVYGYEGKNASKLLQDFRDTFLNIDMLIIRDLEDLFIQLW